MKESRVNYHTSANKLSAAMKDTILNRLNEIEKKETIKILYAVESGSRAWGFASKDSDYDVRFIYMHPLDWYLSIEEKRNVIEYPLSGQLDINGWDIKKALLLFKRSNPPLYEWLVSPIVYIQLDTFVQRLRALMPLFYSPISCLHHYLHMAKGNYREYLRREHVWIKKYFYVLRPIFACMWIEKQKTIPPVEFEKLFYKQKLEQNLLIAIEALLKRKRAGEELDNGNRIEVINVFLEEKIEYFQNYVKTIKGDKPKQGEILDNLFRETIRIMNLKQEA